MGGVLKIGKGIENAWELGGGGFSKLMKGWKGVGNKRCSENW